MAPPDSSDPGAADASDPPHAHTTFADGVLTVTLDRPKKLNAISPEMTQVFWDAVCRLRDDDEVGALLITAEGRFFTAGIDLNSPTGRGGDIAPDDPYGGTHFRRQYRAHHLLYDEMEAVEKPIILAAQGPCLGAGIEMAVSCDIRLCSRSTYFRLPEIDIGAIAGSGGVSRLTRLVGPGWARWMAMIGRPVDAERALAIGLVHDVYEDEGFTERVMQFAREVAALPREAIGVTKLAIDAVDSTDRATARHIERLVNTNLILGPSFTNKQRR